MFPAGGSPGPARAPPLSTAGLASSSPHPLPPRPGALLSYQPALPGAASLRQRPNPSSCAASRLAAALCINLGLHPAKAGAPRSPTRGSAKSCAWGGTTPGTSTCSGLPGWKAALQKKPWRSWWAPRRSRANSVPLPQGPLTASWAALGGVLPAGDPLTRLCQQVIQTRKVILRLCLALLRPHLEHCLQLWAPQYKREMHLLERVQQRAVEMSKALEHLSSEERLSELGLLSLVQRRLTGDLIDIEKGLKGGCKEDGVRLFPSGAWDRAWCPMTGEGILKSSLDMTLAPEKGSSSSSPAPPSPPQRVESMDVELGNRCPVCLDSWDDAAYVMPCLHQFCYGCILRWAGSKPECPLCKRRVQSIVHSVRADDDFEEVVIRPSGLAAASAGTRQAGGAPRHPATHSPPRPVTPQPRAVESVPRAPVGGLQPDTWASLFDDHPALLQRFLPWLQQQLGLLFAEEPSTAVVLEDLILSVLGLFGLDEEVLLRLLEVSLQNRAATFVQQLIDVAVQRCSGEAHRLLGLEDGHAAERREGSPVAAPPPAASRRGSPAPGPAPSGSPAGAGEVEHPSTSTAALHGGPSSPPDAPVPTHGEQEELQEDPGEAAAGASPPSRGRDRSRGGRRRPPKRRAGSSHNSSQPPKRPPRRQK
ncbi:hypothetical protein QYF61_020582 [Mycteria americana]|uniref:E3 ubiquitin-protein ligase Topors n=1 Tax=Mycteria americana TaxID=33587 RepID=A0AAN7NT81_MYCAM|nr:hypothetical protein QYF61_020582 [Mycteria americana]